MPKSYPDIKFNKRGICSLCNKHTSKKQKVFSANEIESCIKSFNQPKRQSMYDCVVLLSGGKDSTYSLFYCKEILKLTPLAVTFDNGFLSDTAVQNITNATNILRVDNVLFRPEWNQLYTLYRVFLINRCEFCTICNVGVKAAGEHAAKKFKIPVIISSHSSYELHAPSIARYYRHGISNFVELIKRYGLKQKNYGFFTKYNDKVKVVNLPDLISWDDTKIRKTLKNKLSWHVPKNKNFHFDCKMFSVANHILIQKYGCGELTCTYSTLIRKGETTRTAALKCISKEESLRTPKEMTEFENILDVKYIPTDNQQPRFIDNLIS